MKLHLDRSAGHYLITAIGPGHVVVNDRRHDHSLVLLPDQVLPDWPVADFAALRPELFEVIAAQRPEVVLLGTGARYRFARPSLYAPLIQAGIGLECMDTAAACRTYNILAAEGRRVAAALIIEPPGAPPAG